MRFIIKKFPCPCCGEPTLTEKDNYEICSNCNWEDDDLQADDPDYEGGANEISLNQAKEAFGKYGDIYAKEPKEIF